MAEESGWKTVDMITRIITSIAGVAIPIVIWQVGQEVQSSERALRLVEHLASENGVERQIAVRIVGDLHAKGQLPGELSGSLLVVMARDEDPEVKDLAVRIANDDPALRQRMLGEIAPQLAARALYAPTGEERERAADTVSQIQQVSGQTVEQPKQLPARLYVHIALEQQRAGMQAIVGELLARREDLRVPGIERKPGPTQTELRYFRDEEAAEAKQITATLTELGLTVETRDTSGYLLRVGEAKIRPRHYELWLSSDPLR